MSLGLVRAVPTAVVAAALVFTGIQCFGPKPAPTPTPDPVVDDNSKPKPKPTPVGGKPVFFIVVEDTLKADTWRGNVLGSPKVESWYKSFRSTNGKQGPIHRLIDINAEGDDPVAIKYKSLAAGRTLPWLWILDENGTVIKDMRAPIEPDAFIAAFETHVGDRALGLVMGAPRLKWVEFGTTPNTPLIPRKDWKPVDLGTFLPPVYDQDGIGQCASSSACTVWATCCNQAGLPYVYASAGDLYSRVNGGHDNGSLLEDNMQELITNGVAPTSMVPYIWDHRLHNTADIKAARLPNRIVEVYLCPDFDAMMSAIQQGFVIQHGIMWYNNFKPDADGWLPASGSGRPGGHALCGYGTAQRNGVWGIKTRNSWGPGWGNSKDGTLGAGNCIIPESLFKGQISGYWAVRAVLQRKSDIPVKAVNEEVGYQLAP